MSSIKCSEYILNDDYEYAICKCPVCGGFLKWDVDKHIPICNKCHTELIALPDHDEETGEEMEWGRICPISMPKKEAEK